MKHLLNILDLSTEEIDELIAVAEDIDAHPEKYEEACRHKILATLFFEPSTRTRLSFETAMLSLGGNVVSVAGANTSSAAKGESVADTAAAVSGYADVIAMRHPKEGAPYVAANHSSVPVINAGDGGHYHPTQTLADLLTVHREKGAFENLTVGFCGDLKYGRTVHSLIAALSRYRGVKFVLISPEELRLPEFVKRDYIEEKGIPYVESASLEEQIGTLDALYMTRVQKERFESEEEYDRLKDTYILTEEKMRLAGKNTIVLHPLPRVNEISARVDDDPRACYFKQTRNGKLMRMALILKLLKENAGARGYARGNSGGETGKTARTNGAENGRETFESALVKCVNPHCIFSCEQELPPLFYRDKRGKVCCAYCDAAAEKA